MIRGGGGLAEGILDTTGNWRGHYWVEVSASRASALVVDITADQFGWDPVRILALPKARDVYRPGEQADVDAAAHSVAIELGLSPDDLGFLTLRPSC